MSLRFIRICLGLAERRSSAGNQDSDITYSRIFAYHCMPRPQAESDASIERILSEVVIDNLVQFTRDPVVNIRIAVTRAYSQLLDPQTGVFRDIRRIVLKVPVPSKSTSTESPDRSAIIESIRTGLTSLRDQSNATVVDDIALELKHIYSPSHS